LVGGARRLNGQWLAGELAPFMAMGFAVSARRSTPPPRPDPVLP
jgi:hypothetical protein